MSPPLTLSPTCTASPLSHLATFGAFVTVSGHSWFVACPESLFTVGLVLGIVQPMDLDKGMMAFIHPYKMHSFTALKIICAFSVFLPPHHTPYPVGIVLPFPEFYTVGIMQCVAFLDWLFSHSNRHLSFLYSVSWFTNLGF